MKTLDLTNHPKLFFYWVGFFLFSCIAFFAMGGSARAINGATSNVFPDTSTNGAATYSVVQLRSGGAQIKARSTLANIYVPVSMANQLVSLAIVNGCNNSGPDINGWAADTYFYLDYPAISPVYSAVTNCNGGNVNFDFTATPSPRVVTDATGSYYVYRFRADAMGSEATQYLNAFQVWGVSAGILLGPSDTVGLCSPYPNSCPSPHPLTGQRLAYSTFYNRGNPFGSPYGQKVTFATGNCAINARISLYDLDANDTGLAQNLSMEIKANGVTIATLNQSQIENWETANPGYGGNEDQFLDIPGNGTAALTPNTTYELILNGISYNNAVQMAILAYDATICGTGPECIINSITQISTSNTNITPGMQLQANVTVRGGQNYRLGVNGDNYGPEYPGNDITNYIIPAGSGANYARASLAIPSNDFTFNVGAFGYTANGDAGILDQPIIAPGIGGPYSFNWGLVWPGTGWLATTCVGSFSVTDGTGVGGNNEPVGTINASCSAAGVLSIVITASDPDGGTPGVSAPVGAWTATVLDNTGTFSSPGNFGAPPRDGVTYSAILSLRDAQTGSWKNAVASDTYICTQPPAIPQCFAVSYSPSSPQPGQQFQINVTIRNAASSGASSFSRPDTKLSISVPGLSYTENDAVYSPGTVDPQGTATFTSPPIQGPAGNYSITVTLSSPTWGTAPCDGSVVPTGCLVAPCSSTPPPPGGCIVDCDAIPPPLVLSSVPYFKIYNGDTIVGAGFNDGINACTSSGRGEVHAFAELDASGGASTEYALQAKKLIDGMYSSSSNSSRTPVPKALTFANTAPDTWGGNFERDDQCIKDYYMVTRKSGTPFTAGPSLRPEELQAASTDSQIGRTGDLTLNGTNTPGGFAGKLAVYVDGDVYITGNINLKTNYTAGNTASIPFFALIVRGNIYISKDVTTLDGMYVAQPITDNTKGVIHTCAAGIGALYSPGDGTANSSAIDLQCRQKLTFNGMVVAKAMRLLRVGGSLYLANSSEQTDPTGANIAEVFNGMPEMYIADTPFKEDPTVNQQYDSAASLPPVL